ncbi:hypothetical protein HYU11_03510 [Candidatus Woesearchaeota archaeon]|nr:hypothetical protein [Candidatus Woesearchaeota archaeon]
MKSKRRYEREIDDLDVMDLELEELDNDELSLEEAAFIYGYEERGE